MTPPTLRGITWNHSRGYLPLVATAQRWHELHPPISIEWERRSLKAFEDAPLEQLARRYDLIVLDHPLIGEATSTGCLLPLDDYLSSDFLRKVAADSVGASFSSYVASGHVWALPIDAATPVAAWRADLLPFPPQTWADLLALAEDGLVEVPAVPINCLVNLYALIHAFGGGFDEAAPEPFPLAATSAALDALAQLLARVTLSSWERNPIETLEALSRIPAPTAIYTPFTYGYSNYARSDYATYPLQFGEPPRLAGALLRTTLGGTGLAISAHCPHREIALAYATFCLSQEIQTGIWTLSGGQPGRRSAWLSPFNHELTHGYFRATLPILERAWVRPRWPGSNAFQEAAGELVQTYARRGGVPTDIVDQLNATAHRYRRLL